MDESAFLQRQSDFWNDLAKQWSLQNKNHVVGWYDAHNNFIHYKTTLFRGIENLHSKKVLEIGCGPARNMIMFHNWFAQFDGVDIAPENIEKAKVNLTDAGLPIPNLWAMDGKSLPMIPDETYDIVFMVISHQHITSRAVRMSLYREAARVLTPGGCFCFQTGFGPGHPRSVDYFAEHFENDVEFVNKDHRVEDMTPLIADLQSSGLVYLDHVFTETVHDEHPQWVFVKTQKA